MSSRTAHGHWTWAGWHAPPTWLTSCARGPNNSKARHVAEPRLTLHGAWPLTPVLRAVAAARGLFIEDSATDDSTTDSVVGAVLSWHTGDAGRQLPLPGVTETRIAVVQHAVTALLTAARPAPDRVTGAVLAPAGGVCGPARHGPI